jgi:hypothetical protein
MKFFSKTFGVFEIIQISLLILIYYYFTFIIDSDIADHAKYVSNYAIYTIAIPANFLYYFVVYLFSFFSSNSTVLCWVSVGVLTFATLFKYVLVKKIISSELAASYTNPILLSSLVSFSLLFAFSLPSLLIFKGLYCSLSLSPNVWHNSTTIFVMPFVILLFWTSLKQLKEFQVKRLFLITVLIITTVLIKPSFIFVFVVAYPIFLFKKQLFSKLFWINLIPIFLAFLIIIVEYYFIYVESPAEDKSSIAIDLFYIINTRYAHGNWIYVIAVFLSTLVSGFLFPIVLLYRNSKLFKEEMIQFAILCSIIGIIIGSTLYETGYRSLHGNLGWQNVMCSFLLFLVCTLQLLKLIEANPLRWKAYRIEISMFALHFLFGILYFFKVLVTASYS